MTSYQDETARAFNEMMRDLASMFGAMPKVDEYRVTSWQVGDVQSFIRHTCEIVGDFHAAMIKGLKCRCYPDIDPEAVRHSHVANWDERGGFALGEYAEELRAEEEDENPSRDPNREHRIGCFEAGVGRFR